MSKRVLAIVLLLLTMAVPSAPVVEAHGNDADVIFEWNRLLQQTMPPTAGLQGFRFYAILHVAMFDAINSIEERYSPFRVNVRASHGASSKAAAAQAAHDILSAVNPTASAIALYDAELAETLASIPPGRRAQGVRVGQKVAEEILTWRQNDGWNAPATPYVLPPFPGLWQPTPPGFMAAGFTQAAGVTPFALLTVTQYLPPIPPTLTSTKYAEHLNYVKGIGQNSSTLRLPDQTEAAELWGGVTTKTTTNLMMIWNNIARDTTLDRGLDLIETARVFALTNVSMHDGILTSQYSKFVYGLWRPVTAIQRADEDLNDATEAVGDWLPLLTTPPYPAYAGNMSCIGASAATVLALAFGTNDVSFSAVWKNAVSTQPDYVRNFSGFWQAAQEQANSRVWGGIHFPFDSEASQLVCPKVSQWAFNNFMVPKRHGWSW